MWEQRSKYLGEAEAIWNRVVKGHQGIFGRLLNYMKEQLMQRSEGEMFQAEGRAGAKIQRWEVASGTKLSPMWWE